jgi:hypothetical protein
VNEAKQLRALSVLGVLRYKARAAAHRATPKMAMGSKYSIITIKCAILTGIFCVGEVEGVDTLMPVQGFLLRGRFG